MHIFEIQQEVQRNVDKLNVIHFAPYTKFKVTEEEEVIKFDVSWEISERGEEPKRLRKVHSISRIEIEASNVKYKLIKYIVNMLNDVAKKETIKIKGVLPKRYKLLYYWSRNEEAEVTLYGTLSFNRYRSNKQYLPSDFVGDVCISESKYNKCRKKDKCIKCLLKNGIIEGCD